MKDDEPAEATFTYSVQWRETDTPYEKRMDKYRRYQFLPQHLEVDCLYLQAANVLCGCNHPGCQRATALRLEACAAGDCWDFPGSVLQHAEIPAPLSPSLHFRDAWLLIHSAMHDRVKKCRHAV